MTSSGKSGGGVGGWGQGSPPFSYLSELGLIQESCEAVNTVLRRL